jgi:hypothetical protein
MDWDVDRIQVFDLLEEEEVSWKEEKYGEASAASGSFSSNVDEVV